MVSAKQTFGNSSNTKSNQQQHQSQYQQPAAQHLPISQPPHQQKFPLKLQCAMHQKKQLTSTN